ncbi:MAG: hypothetical protein Kow0027_31200 [Saprospiraceae bacterium]|mgnify:CR=1 FL=1|nr:hypothetical protein [Saprospirales bacterium]|tara:strand:+ start:267 stop:602 length:336 start_codon:yes stop_codon:yes gene_type:complete
MKLLLDANLSWRLIKPLKNSFEDVEHVNELPIAQPAKDIEIWNFAKMNNWIIVTCDEDFYNFHLIKGFPPKIILLRKGNLRTEEVATLFYQYKEVIKAFHESPHLGVLELV